MPNEAKAALPADVDSPEMEQAKRLEVLLPSLTSRLFATSDSELASDLTAGQLRICLLIQNEDRCISEISEEMGVTVSAVTQLADRLEKANIVARVADARDRRIRRLRLTEQGRTLLQTRREARVRRAAAALILLSPEAANALCDGVQGLMEAACRVLPEVQSVVADIVSLLG